MSLTPVNIGGNPEIIGLSGVYSGQAQPELLGVRNLSDQAGPFFYGFDDRIRPTMVRIFFDPNLIPSRGHFYAYDTIGLIQIGRITYQNMPISPETYGMHLDHLYPYNYNNIFDERDAHHWVDMIDVKTLRGKVDERGESHYPFFAFNGYHRNAQYTLSNFYQHPMPNGSLTSAPVPNVLNASLCASLYDAIDFDLDVPPATAITAMIKRLQKNSVTPYETKTYTRDEVLQQGALNLVINLLGIADLITSADIQVAGPHIIIQMADVEDEAPVAIAFFDSNQETINTSTLMIYLVDGEELEQLRFALLTQTFENFKTSLSGGLFSSAIGPGFPIDRPPGPGKGNKGLKSFPFFFKDDVNPVIAFTYTTVAVGIQSEKIVTCFDCLEWQVWRTFHRDELEFGPLKIEKPRLNREISSSYDNYLKGLAKEDKRFMYPVVNQYQKALQESSSSVDANPYFYEDTQQWLKKA